MSKVGRSPIAIPDSVQVALEGKTVKITGPQGELTHTLPPHISVLIKDGTLSVNRDSDSKQVKALHGLTRALLANMCLGVTKEFTKKLELVGTGYRAKLSGSKLILSLGFSHEVSYDIPSGLKISLEGTNLITVSGVNKHLVGQAAANIRAFKKPEPYKGKGIKYYDEVVRRKAGKAAKAAA